MDRIITVVLALLLIAVLAAGGLLVGFNPMGTKKVALAEQIAKITPIEVKFQRRDLDVDSVQKKLAAKPQLWDELLAPPPPEPKAPPPPPPIEEMAKTITFGRQQIGGKVKMTKAGEKKGEFLAVGDTVNGLTVKEITKTSVVLSLSWQGQELTTTKERK